MLFQKVSEMWLEDKKAYIKQSTYAYYRFEVDHYISPILGRLPMENINEDQIQNAVLFWQTQGMKKGYPLKKSTVQNLVVLLKQIINFAIRKKLMEDIAIKVQFASQTVIVKQKVFDSYEQSKLINAILNNLNYKTFGILLCLNTGLRIGEMCALKWNDLDPKRGILHVTKTLQRIYVSNEEKKTKIIITSPKTGSSIREIPLAKRIVSTMQLLPNDDQNNYILTNNEYYLEPRSFRRYYNLFLQKNEILSLNFHCLRHTFATRLIENGADYKAVSELLGHATIHTTLNMYVHPRIEEKRKCVEMFEWNL